MNRTSILAAACVLQALFYQPAWAETEGTRGESVRIVLGGAEVSYADLDLRNERDRAVLDRRVARAARAVCDNFGTVTTRARSEERCIERVMAQTRRELARVAGVALANADASAGAL